MTRQSEAIAAQLEREATKATRAFVFQLLKYLRSNPSSTATGTPVDTGHARANWILSTGSPGTGQVAGTRGDGNVASILTWSLSDGPIFVNNNVPYILRLNDGWSAQQPSGFIERAIDESQEWASERFAGSNIIVGTEDSLGGAGAANVASAYSPFGGNDD